MYKKIYFSLVKQKYQYKAFLKVRRRFIDSILRMRQIPQNIYRYHPISQKQWSYYYNCPPHSSSPCWQGTTAGQSHSLQTSSTHLFYHFGAQENQIQNIGLVEADQNNRLMSFSPNQLFGRHSTKYKAFFLSNLLLSIVISITQQHQLLLQLFFISLFSFQPFAGMIQPTSPIDLIFFYILSEFSFRETSHIQEVPPAGEGIGLYKHAFFFESLSKICVNCGDQLHLYEFRLMILTYQFLVIQGGRGCQHQQKQLQMKARW